jgi:3-oxoacyl-[acyl-carrier protein] reductase
LRLYREEFAHDSTRREGNVKGKVAVVTGSAVSIGAGIALRFAAEGADVVVNYSKSKAEAEATAEGIRKKGSRALVVQADISREADCDRLIATAVKEFGRLDILVNNAGTTEFVELADLDGMTAEKWDRIFNLNVKGLFFCCRAAAKHLPPGGVIINLSSVAAFTGRGSSLAYCASKAAVSSITRSLAIGLAPRVRVMAIAPGMIDTRWNVGRESRVKEWADKALLKRAGGPDDIAGMALYLARDATFATGQTYLIDGGVTL